MLCGLASCPRRAHDVGHLRDVPEGPGGAGTQDVAVGGDDGAGVTVRRLPQPDLVVSSIKIWQAGKEIGTNIFIFCRYLANRIWSLLAARPLRLVTPDGGEEIVSVSPSAPSDPEAAVAPSEESMTSSASSFLTSLRRAFIMQLWPAPRRAFAMNRLVFGQQPLRREIGASGGPPPPSRPTAEIPASQATSAMRAALAKTAASTSTAPTTRNAESGATSTNDGWTLGSFFGTTNDATSTSAAASAPASTSANAPAPTSTSANASAPASTSANASAPTSTSAAASAPSYADAARTPRE